MTARKITALTFEGLDLGPHLAQLAEQGWTVVENIDVEQQRALRRVLTEVERIEGWWVRTEYRADNSSLSVARSVRR